MQNRRNNGRITQDEYDKKARELKEKQYKLTEKLKSLTEADEKFGIADLASKAYELFESSKIYFKFRLQTQRV